MNNVKTLVNCPKCLALGKQVKDYGRIIAMQCPACGLEWSTLKIGGKSK